MYKNRILISLGLVAGLTFLGIKSFATSTGVVNTETARMRAESNTTSNIVALVSQDEKVEILEKSGDWYKVKYKDNTGYIYAQYVDNKDNESEQSTNNTTVNNETENNDLLRISCRCNNGNSQNLLTINSDCLGTADDNDGNSCGCGNNNAMATLNNRSCSKRKCYTKSI